MNRTSIKVLKLLINGQKEKSELLKILDIKDRYLAYVIKNLTESGYINKENSTIKLENTPKVTLLKDVVQIIDVEKLLDGSNETVFSSIGKNITIGELEKNTGLSKTTVHRSISELRSIGAIVKNNGEMQINEREESLVSFANILQLERSKRYEDENTEIIYSSNMTTLRKTSSGKIVKGVTTGFSLFSEYGIDYHTINDYFCEQQEDLDIQDVLLHAVYSAVKSENKMELLMCIIFYAKHKDKMDVLQLRKKSSSLKIADIWVGIEAYMRGKILIPELFLPWKEFLIKAELYEIPVEKYTLPEPSDIFREISDKLDEEFTIYLFGGENMRMKSLKDRTKDCDVVVKNKNDFDNLAQILFKMGYFRTIKTEYSDEDIRINPDDIFKHENKSRVDLFTFKIMQELKLTSTMEKRADIKNYGKLKVGLLRNEDVFLLKAVASREGDIQDMRALVEGNTNTPPELQHDSFDWDLVWNEILMQEHQNHTQDFTNRIFECISIFSEQTGIIVPFFDKLKRHSMDRIIEKLLRGGNMLMKEIIEILTDYDITETTVRNRLDSLEKSKNIEKFTVENTTYVRLLKNNEFIDGDIPINMYRLTRYIDWRFFRPGVTDITSKKIAEELKEFGFQTITDIDLVVKHTTDILKQYEEEQFQKNYFNGAGAIRICIGLHYPKIGKKRSMNYFISDFSKYHTLARKRFIPVHPKQMVSK